MDIIEIMNTILDNSSQQYQERIPVATKANFTEVGNAILAYEATQNEFSSALVNRVCYPVALSRRFTNPLAVLKGTAKPFGTDIEEIYVNPVSAVTFNGSQTDDMLKVTKPDVKTIFHRMNRQDKYPVSISTPQLQKAFLSLDEMQYLINSIINAMYSGDEMDEYLLMRNLVSGAITEKKMKSLELTYDGKEETAKDLVKLIKTLSGNFCFPSKDYNGYNELNAEAIAAKTCTPCTTWTPVENQIFLIRTDVDAATDVEVLAKAFNMDKTNFLKRKIVVDSFGDADTLCAIMDEAVFRVSDDLYQVRSFNNGSNLVENYWLHHWQTLSLSLFGNAVAIKGVAPAEAAAAEVGE